MGGGSSIDWYDLPLYYEIAFQELSASEVAFIDAVAREMAPAGGRLLEAACGAGRLLAPLAARGYRVTGFDRSRSMLTFARDRLAAEGLEGNLFRGDLAAFRLESRRFEIALCAVNSFRYLLDAASARGHLRRMADVLVPGGIYLLGLHLSDYAEAESSRERWAGERNGIDVRCTVTSWPVDRGRRIERLRSRLTATEGGQRRVYDSAWSFRTYSAAQLRGLIASVPSFEHIATYGFDFDATRPRALGGDDLDAVLVLRRR